MGSRKSLPSKGCILISKGANYSGELTGQILNGYGTLTFSNGTTYKGNWKNGKLSGQASLSFSNGDKAVWAFSCPCPTDY